MASTNLAYAEDFALVTEPFVAPEREFDRHADRHADRQADRQAERRRDIRVVPGGAAEQLRVTAILTTLAQMTAVVIVVVAALCFARIMLTNMAVSTMRASEDISSDITAARSAGLTLEMEQSVLSTAPAVKAQAKRLGMTTSRDVTTITLAPDVVAIQNGDTLSLSDTIKNVVDTQG